jgi:hypothetical protein
MGGLLSYFVDQDGILVRSGEVSPDLSHAIFHFDAVRIPEVKGIFLGLIFDPLFQFMLESKQRWNFVEVDQLFDFGINHQIISAGAS